MQRVDCEIHCHRAPRSQYDPPPPLTLPLPASPYPNLLILSRYRSSSPRLTPLPHACHTLSSPPPFALPVLAVLFSVSLHSASSSSSWSNGDPALRTLLMASYRHLPVVLLACAALLGVARYAEGQVLFSTLPKTLLVTATLPGGGPITEVRTGQDTIVVSWKVNTTAAPITASKVRTKLCFAKVSQESRQWRVTKDDLAKDKTCLYDIAVADYTPAGASANFLLPTFVPGAKYFVRAYAVDAHGLQVATGQSSPDKVANIFTVIPISGRYASMDVAVAILSVFSVGSLITFFVLESIFLKRKKSV